MNAACSSATSTGPSPSPAASAAMRVDGESSRARNDGLWHSVRWSKPVMYAGRSTQLAGPVAGGEHHGRGAVGDRREVVAAERLAHVVLGEERRRRRPCPGTRTATSAIDRSSAMPAPITARACSAANVSGSAPSGAR